MACGKPIRIHEIRDLVKLYLESTEDLQKEFKVEESRSSDNESRLRNLSSSELSS